MTASMLRRGGAGLDAVAIEQRLDELGATLYTHAGFTSSSLQLTFLKRSLGPVAELVGGLLGEPHFEAAELERLARQIEAEIVESRDSDELLAARALRRHLFRDHPHGARPSGTIATVRQVEPSDLRRFHEQHYLRERAVVGVSGDLSSAECERLARDLLDALPAGSAAADYPAGPPARPRGRNLVLVDKPGRSQSQVVIGTLGTHADDPDHIPLLVANTAFGETFSSRLTQEVRAKRGWSYGAWSQLALGRVRESFTMWTAPAAGDTAACIALELELLSRWRRDGIDQAELDFCKSYLRNSYAFQIDTARKRVLQGVDRELLGLPADYHQRFVERVDAVTPAQASAAVRNRIADDALWIGLVATEAELGDAVRAAVPELAEAVVEPYDLE